MPEEGIQLRDKSEFMTSEEVITIAKTFVNQGVDKIRLTGGEPLIKKNAAYIITELGKLPVELGITTNGILVDQYIDVFKDSGLKSVNVSLDSLKKDKVNEITRRNFADRIFSNIELLIKEDFNVKLNVVLIKGVNDDEILDFIQLTRQWPVSVRFIEFMPFNGNNWERDKTISFNEIVHKAKNKFGEKVIKLTDKRNDTTRNFKIKNYKGSFGIISTVTNPFCDTCNRIRLTADGKIKNCLFSTNEFDLLTALRNNEAILPIIQKAIILKRKSKAGFGNFTDSKVKIYASNRSMTAIGG
ncbi:MAG: GTP 3',8-cyclase MoaA [Vicingaceae bacterium]